jgi:hypothetical protein
MGDPFSVVARVHAEMAIDDLLNPDSVSNDAELKRLK